MINAELHNRAITATVKFLNRRGMNIVTSEHSEPLPVVATDDDNTLVFVHVTEGFVGFDDNYPNRSDVEESAFDFLANHPDFVGYSIRLDVISLRIAGEDRALLRHHINAYSEKEPVC